MAGNVVRVALEATGDGAHVTRLLAHWQPIVEKLGIHTDAALAAYATRSAAADRHQHQRLQQVGMCKSCPP
jgi:hypothetical protein